MGIVATVEDNTSKIRDAVCTCLLKISISDLGAIKPLSDPLLLRNTVRFLTTARPLHISNSSLPFCVPENPHLASEITMKFMFGGLGRSLQTPTDERNKTRENPERLGTAMGEDNRVKGINNSHHNASDVSMQESTPERPEISNNAAHEGTDYSNVDPESVSNDTCCFVLRCWTKVHVRAYSKKLKIT